MPDDVWQRVFEQRANELGVGARVLAERAELVGADRPAGRRLEETKEFFEFVRGELPAMIDRWWEQGGRPGPDRARR